VRDNRADIESADEFRGGDDHGAYLLAHHLVRHTDGSGLGDAGRAGERVLHLHAGDVLPTADDDVLGAVDDAYATGVVDPDDVSGAQPPVDKRGGGGIGPLPIPRGDVGAPR
jgi:hypothetical protein